jgi:hypothetical protein
MTEQGQSFSGSLFLTLIAILLACWMSVSQVSVVPRDLQVSLKPPSVVAAFPGERIPAMNAFGAELLNIVQMR